MINTMDKKRRRTIEINVSAMVGFLSIMLSVSLPYPNSTTASQLMIAAAANTKGALAQTRLEIKEEEYNEAVDIDHAEAAYMRGEAHFSSGRFRKAVGNYSTAIEILGRHKGLDDYKGQFYFKRGLAYDRLEQHQEAISDYTHCIALNPEIIIAYNNRSVANFKLRRYRDAISDANNYLKHDQKHAEMYAIRGFSKVIMKDPKGLVDLKIAAGMGHKLAQDALRHAKIQW